MPCPVIRISCTQQAMDAADVHRAARALHEPEGLAVVPTDTVYGLACRCDRPFALNRLLRLKDRPPDKPLALIVSDMEMMRQQLSPSLSPPRDEVLARCLPGPLTFIVRSFATHDLHRSLISQVDAVAVRIPDCPVLLQLIRALRMPLICTSANLSGAPPPASPAEIDPRIRDGVDVLLDAGPAPLGQPSTIIDLTLPCPHVVREGALAGAELDRLLQELCLPGYGPAVR